MPNNQNNQTNQKPQNQQTQDGGPQSGQNAPGRNQDVGSKDGQDSRRTEDDARNPRQGQGQGNRTEGNTNDTGGKSQR